MGDGERDGQVNSTRDKFNAMVEEVRRVGCVVREDGRKNHVFLDHSNICQCRDVDLNVYRKMELR